MKKSSEDFAKFVSKEYGEQYLFEFNVKNNNKDFVITPSDKKNVKTIENCQKCHKMIVSLLDKKSYYIHNLCNNCHIKESDK
jgi:ribosome maturation factor RimP